MNCEQVALSIDAHLDGETSGDESRRLAQHVQQCARCSAQFAPLLQAVEVLGGLPDLTAPADLIPQILHELPVRTARRVAWALGATGAFATAGIAAVFIGVIGLAPQWWGSIATAAKALIGPIADLALRLFDAATIVAPACGQLFISALLIDVVLLVTCIMAVIAWQRRSVPTAVFITW